MSFYHIGRSTADHQVRVSITKAYDRRTVRFVIGALIAEKLGLKVGDRCKIMIGEDDDAGRVCLSPDPLNRRSALVMRAGAESSMQVCVQIGSTLVKRGWLPDIMPMAAAVFEIEDGALLLDMPSWWPIQPAGEPVPLRRPAIVSPATLGKRKAARA